MAAIENRELASLAASGLVARYGLKRPADIELEAICWGEGLLTTEGPIESADAWLVVRKTLGMARVRESIPYLGQKRFALAHELGHWLLHRLETDAFYDDSFTLASYQRDPRELQASAFASDLLVPDEMLLAVCPRIEVSLEAGLAVSAMFSVGPFVALRKLIAIPGANALLVVSDGEKMLYHRRSQRCTLYSPAAKCEIPQGPTREAVTCVGKICSGPTDARGWTDRAHRGAPWYEEALKPDAESPVVTLLRWGRR